MISDLLVPFRDTRAEHLALELRVGPVPTLPALASLHVEVENLALDLHILGGSHQIQVTADGDELSEVVSCDVEQSGDLPRTRSLSMGSWQYTFGARILRCAPDGLARLATALERHSDSRPGVLIGRFPGHRSAMTALAVQPEPTGVRWRTWHLYPGAGEVVCTRSVLRPA